MAIPDETVMDPQFGAMHVFSRVLQIDEPHSGPAVCAAFGYLCY